MYYGSGIIKKSVVISSLLLANSAAFAQNERFTVGQHVQYKPNQFQDIWEDGVVTKVLPETTPGLRQVVIRSDNPNPYNPNMHDEVAYQVEHVRTGAGQQPRTPEAAAPNAEAPEGGGGQFKVGDKVMFKPNQFQDHWEEGTVTKLIPQSAPGLKQVLIRSTKPSPYNPNMFDEIAYQVEHVRHAGGGAPQAMPTAGNPWTPAQQPNNRFINKDNQGNLPNPGGAAAAPTGNVGQLLGRWSLLQVGHTVDYAPGDGWIYRKNEIGAQAGTITINPDHTFVWNSLSRGLIQGNWRPATASESNAGFPGPSIRLLKGEMGWDYTVNLRPKQKAGDKDSIAIWTSGYQVNAYRM